MNTRNSRIRMLLSIGAASLLALGATAQTSAPAPVQTPALPPGLASPARLPYGVEDVVELTRAQISEDIILNYIQYSGTIYNLRPIDIICLRDEGVSDRVINTMLDQHANVPAQQALQAQPFISASVPVPTNFDLVNLPTATVVIQPPPVYVPPAPVPVYVPPAPVPVYVPPPPAPVPASTLYIIPYRSSR